MDMDGDIINEGDNVHDLIFGAGIIERLMPEEEMMWVRFSPQNLRCFNNGGFGSFKERTLFWRNPITVPPHKHDHTWDVTHEIHEAVSKILKRTHK